VIDVKFMTAERWVSLLRSAEVPILKLEELVVDVISGPCVLPPETGRWLILVDDAHATNLTALWPEIEKLWAETPVSDSEGVSEAPSGS
jgi:hypothetical protein